MNNNKIIICIYMMVNIITGQMYIGQTKDFYKRIKEHFGGYGSDRQWIDRVCLKYGSEAFLYRCLAVFDEYDKDVLNDSEKYFIAAYNTFKNPKHYNLTPGGDGAGAGEDHYNYLDDLDRNAFKEDYANGLSLTKIANKYNVSRNTVREYLISEGVHTSKSRHSTSKSKSYHGTGYYRVSKKENKNYIQGFLYVYSYRENGKKKTFKSVDINKLEAKVIAKGLPWRIIDEEKARATLEFCLNFKKYF